MGLNSQLRPTDHVLSIYHRRWNSIFRCCPTTFISSVTYPRASEMHLLRTFLPYLVLAATAPTIGAVPVTSQASSTHILERRNADWRQRVSQVGQWIRDKSLKLNWRGTPDPELVARLQRLSAVTSWVSYLQKLPQEIQDMFEDCLRRNGMGQRGTLTSDIEIAIMLQCKEELRPIWGPRLEYFESPQDRFLGRYRPDPDDQDQDERGGSRSQFSELRQELEKIPGVVKSYFAPGAQKQGPVNGGQGGLRLNPGRKGF